MRTVFGLVQHLQESGVKFPNFPLSRTADEVYELRTKLIVHALASTQTSTAITSLLLSPADPISEAVQSIEDFLQHSESSPVSNTNEELSSWSRVSSTSEGDAAPEDVLDFVSSMQSLWQVK